MSVEQRPSTARRHRDTAPRPSLAMTAEDTHVQRLQHRYRLHDEIKRKILAEFVATTFLMYVGFNVNVQTTFGGGSSIASALGWGLALLFAVQSAYRISGSHLNPAISFAVYTLGQMTKVEFLLYSCAQIVACFVASALTFIHYYDKINDFDGGIRQVFGPQATAQLFATYPAPQLSIVNAIFDQTAATAALAFTVGIITDAQNQIPKYAQPTLLGLMLTLISLAFGLNAGNAMSKWQIGDLGLLVVVADPARDFAPRVFTLLSGYGWDVFAAQNGCWWLIPLICPFVGAALGSWIYALLISLQQPLHLGSLSSSSDSSSNRPSSSPSIADLVALTNATRKLSNERSSHQHASNDAQRSRKQQRFYSLI